MRKPKVMNNFKKSTYWKIWAIGYHSIRDYRKELIELKVFIGPLILTFWR